MVKKGKAKSTTMKAKAKAKKGEKYVCGACGMTVVVDKECCCDDPCDITCCGEDMKIVSCC